MLINVPFTYSTFGKGVIGSYGKVQKELPTFLQNYERPLHNLLNITNWVDLGPIIEPDSASPREFYKV